MENLENELNPQGYVTILPIAETDFKKVVKSMHILSKKDKGNLMAITAAAIGMDMIDFQDVLEIIQENISEDIIIPVKEKMYTQEEMIEIAWKAIFKGFVDGKDSKYGLNHLKPVFNKWLKQNL